MSWELKFSKTADKSLRKLDISVQERIINFLEERIIVQEREPRSFGEALTGGLGGLWKYRVGDYRLICQLQDEVLTVLVLDLAHRKQVYKRK